uniref:NDR1/HIN1-like 8 n=1 Tax=Tanacetum cinerariifolium TaxID=118510 RepID=A0A6L2JXE3_TANCI|nr:NDR1/HIN1-like 8 [Tanacetum cinerariifolium]
MMRRGGSSKRRPKQHKNNLNDENWSYRPLQQHQHHINSSINHQQQKDQPCSSSSSQLYPKVAPNLTVPSLLVLNNQESSSLNYAGKDETNKDKEVCLSDDLNASKEDCVSYEYEYEDDDDAVNKLEKLRLCGEEADLSDDVFKDNDHLQLD